jgi:hypothetical protein
MIKLSSDDQNVQDFLDLVHSSLKKMKFKLVLTIDNLFVGKSSVSGYFDEVDKVIKISILDEDFLEVLVHEFCHFLQFSEGDPKYTRLFLNGENMLDELWSWLDGYGEMETKRKNLIFNSVIEMERDCEKRTIELIKKYSLPIDLDNYKNNAIMYLYYYTYAKKFRTWFLDEISFDDLEEIDMTSLSLDDNFKKLPVQLLKSFKKISKSPLTT